MDLGELISKFYKDKTPIKVVPKYGAEIMWGYQKDTNGFLVNDYDEKTGLVELLKLNKRGKEIKIYLYLQDISQIIDDNKALED